MYLSNEGGFSVDEENRIRSLLNAYLESVEENASRSPTVDDTEDKERETACEDERQRLAALRRLRAKLNMRHIKRSRHMKLFDIDAYTNELIDRERARRRRNQQQEASEKAQEDVIFEYKTLKTSAYETDSKQEVIEITRVLDRFKREEPLKRRISTSLSDSAVVYFLDKMPIGMVESRNDDIKCLLSPFTNKLIF